jgi:hypothetical protein
MVGGIPVGSFNDSLCNVSRFVGVLESNPGQPKSRSLSWSKYYGFFWPVYSGTPGSSTMLGYDIENGCIQRFSDSRSILNGSEVLIFNHFIQTVAANLCTQQLNNLYAAANAVPPDPAQVTAASVVLNACETANLKAQGNWVTAVLDESTGATISDNSNSYTWGWLNNFYPGTNPVYLVEAVASNMKFDFSDQTVPQIQARTLSPSGQWQTLGSFPVALRPEVNHVLSSGSRGVAASTYYADLYTADIDNDGLQDVRLTDGRYVGYSSNTNAFVIKAAQSVPVINFFTASTTSITAGQSINLNWSVGGSATLVIDQNIGSVTGSSVSVGPVQTTTYTLTATNGSGSVTRNVTVNVSALPGGGNIAWTNAVGLSVSGNNLTKTAPTGWGNAGAVSTQSIASGNGYIEFRTNEATTYKVLGFAATPINQDHTKINFGINPGITNNVNIWEKGQIVKFNAASYTSSDVFRIVVEFPAVKYYKNSLLIYTSTLPPIYPLIADAVMYDNNSTIINAKLAYPTSTPILGDINLDHIVNSVDFSILNSHWFSTDPVSDLNHDGLVNAIDFSLLNSNWFRTW